MNDDANSDLEGASRGFFPSFAAVRCAVVFSLNSFSHYRYRRSTSIFRFVFTVDRLAQTGLTL
jgi:hypothetical protein